MSEKSATPHTLEILLGRVGRERDVEAYEQLFRMVGARLITYFGRLGHDSLTAEDLAQEVMLLVWHRAASYNPEIAPASAWIFTIARNRRIDHLRALAREAVDESGLEFAPEREIPADEAMQNRHMAEKLAAALKNLPREQSEAIFSSYFEHKSQSEIAQACNLPLGTVKSRLRLGLTRLRVMIGED